MNKSLSAADTRRHPGLKSLRVLYDFTYVSPEGKDISIKQGEKLTLLDKTDSDWWKVRRFKTPFYVPANYVTEIDTPSGPSGDGMDMWETTMRSGDIAEWASGGLLGLTWKLRMSASWSGHGLGASQAEGHTACWPAEGVSMAAPRRTGLGLESSGEPVNGHHVTNAADSRNTKGQRSLWRKTPVSHRIEQRSPALVRTRSSYLPAVDSNTSVLRDNARGHHTIGGSHDSGPEESEEGYVQDAARESAPAQGRAGPSQGYLHSSRVEEPLSKLAVGTASPVWAEAGFNQLAVFDAADARSAPPEAFPVGGESKKGSSPSPATSSKSGAASLEYQGSRKLVKQQSLKKSSVKGWTETAGHQGQQTFVHNATGEKWLSAEDSSGRPYYYKENTDQTVWELPEYTVQRPRAAAPPPPPPTARSLSMPEPEAQASAEAGAQHGRMQMPTLGAALMQASRHQMPLVTAVIAARRGGSGATQQQFHARPLSAPSARGSDRDDFRAAADSENRPTGLSSAPPAVGEASTNVGDAGTAAIARLRLLQTNEVLKQDVMQTCRLSDSGRKGTKRSWEQSCVLATATHLHIYREERSTPKKAAEEASLENSKPDAVLSLSSAKVLWTTQKTSKKNVLEVACDSECYLLQHDDPLLMREWYKLLLGGRSPTSQQPSPLQDMRDTSSKDPSSLDIPDDLRGDDQAKDGVWRAKGSRFKRGGMYNLSSAPNMASVREKLKGLLARRPSMKDLEAKGIIRENIFNTHLLFLCNREQTTVPKFVERCIAAIETKGLDAEGLYRVTPSASEVQALRNQIDGDDMYTLSNWDIHVLAGALKMFFRELQEPLIPFDYYKWFMDALGIGDQLQQLSTFKLLISMMLPATRDTLHILMAHLVRVSEHCDKNKMTVENIAKVFGQTLMRPEEDMSAASLSSAHCHNAVIEYILTNYAKIF